MKIIGITLIILFLVGCQTPGPPTSHNGGLKNQRSVVLGEITKSLPIIGSHRDDEPRWAVERDDARIEGIVIDVASETTVDEPEDRIPIAESSKALSRPPCAIVRIENGLEVLATNLTGADLAQGDRVLLRIFETPGATRKLYDIAEILNAQ